MTKRTYKHILSMPPLSETQRKALDNMQSIWLKFATYKPSLENVCSCMEVQAACQIVASHHLQPAHETISAIELGNVPLLNEFFDELSKLPGMQSKLDAIQQVKDAWLEYLQPPKVTFTVAEVIMLLEMGVTPNEIGELSNTNYKHEESNRG